jgi:hypothetical protein
MADVVVDQKAMDKLPYDPKDIPDAVKQRAAAVDALYGQNGQLNESGGEQQQSPETPVPPQSVPEAAPAPQVPPAVVSPTTPAPAPAPAESLDDDNSVDGWKRRYLRMQGRFNAAEKTIGEMQVQMTQLGDELLQTTQRRQSAPQNTPTPPQSPVYLTEQDEQNYGRDLINFTQRAAAEVVAPHLNEVKNENAELRRRLAQEARHRLDQAVELAVPNYREIDRDPRWHNWLLGVDLLSGRVRQTLLNEAISTASAPRVISFFKGFLQEEVATGHLEPAPSPVQAAPPREPAIPLASLAAPGRARPATGGDSSLPPDRPTYTRADIKQNYRLHQQGAWSGREAEWNRLEHDMIAAGREGRVRA